MVTKELVQDSYITELRQIGGLVDKYRLTRPYVGTISPSPNYETDEMSIDELLTFRHGYGITSGSVIFITIRRQAAQIREGPLAYQSGNEEMATFPKIVQEKASWAFSVAGRSDTALTSGSVMEELKEFLRKQTRGLVEVCPGFTVTREEYERRFGGVDLDYYRDRMKPDVFRAFVRSMGTVRGVERLSDRSLEEYED